MTWMHFDDAMDDLRDDARATEEQIASVRKDLEALGVTPPPAPDEGAPPRGDAWSMGAAHAWSQGRAQDLEEHLAALVRLRDEARARKVAAADATDDGTRRPRRRKRRRRDQGP